MGDDSGRGSVNGSQVAEKIGGSEGRESSRPSYHMRFEEFGTGLLPGRCPSVGGRAPSRHQPAVERTASATAGVRQNLNELEEDVELVLWRVHRRRRTHPDKPGKAPYPACDHLPRVEVAHVQEGISMFPKFFRRHAEARQIGVGVESLHERVVAGVAELDEPDAVDEVHEELRRGCKMLVSPPVSGGTSSAGITGARGPA
jgi:hypothetical protein